MQIEIVVRDDGGKEMIKMVVSQPDSLGDGVMEKLREYFSSAETKNISSPVVPSVLDNPSEPLNEITLNFLETFRHTINNFKKSKAVLNPGIPDHLWNIYVNHITPEILTLFNLMLNGGIVFDYFKTLNIPNKNIAFLMFYHSQLDYIERKAELISTTTQKMDEYLKEIS